MDTEWKVDLLPSASRELDQLGRQCSGTSHSVYRGSLLQSISRRFHSTARPSALVSDSLRSGPIPGYLSSFLVVMAGIVPNLGVEALHPQGVVAAELPAPRPKLSNIPRRQPTARYRSPGRPSAAAPPYRPRPSEWLPWACRRRRSSPRPGRW